MLAWSRAINLPAIREPADAARLHVLDSLTAVRPLRDRGIDAFLDLGSGGGYPGLPLALALPATEAVLVDSVGKKVAFLETVVSALPPVPEGSPTIRARRARAEELSADPLERERWPAVLVRAVADLGELIELSFPLLRPGGWLIAWKRGDIVAELSAAEGALDALGGGAIDIRDAALAALPGHRLVFVRKDRPTAPRWPRPVAERRRRAW